VLGGSTVVVRPSSITACIVERIFEILGPSIKALPIELASCSGSQFIERVVDDADIQTLLFTGSFPNLSRLQPILPNSKRLIYCGSGINPFIVGKDCLKYLTFQEIASTIVKSRIYNSGQDCLCSERILIAESVADDFIDVLTENVRQICVGEYRDHRADVVPLLGNIADSVAAQVSKVHSDQNWLVPFKREGSLIHPSLVELSLADPLLNAEKFAPVFTIARYSDDTELTKSLTSKYRFGATVIGSYNSTVLSQFPHISRLQTVIEDEAEDCHVPFGGCGRSGFVRNGLETKDGPILYSIETTDTHN